MEWKNAILFSIDDTWSSFLRFTTLLTFNSWILSHKTNFVNVEIILENDFTISVANLYPILFITKWILIVVFW